MNLRPDGAGDHVVSFDAFKLTRHGGARATAWHVAALTPWAFNLIERATASIPPHERPQYVRHSRTDRIIGASFDTRGAALDFLRDVEEYAERWSS